MKFMISNSKAKYFNLKDFELSNEIQRSFLVKNLDKICKNTGFLLINGHGINKKIINNIWSVVDIFFDQPINLKERVRPPFKGYPYGYLGHGIEALAHSKGNKTPPDLKESFNAGPISIPKSVNQKDALEFCYAPSLWPEISNFKNYWIEYYNSMQNLAWRIMRALALALNLDENYFNSYINEPISALRALNYPSLQDIVLPNQQMAGAHTDYGSLTILLPKDETRGLQIQNLDGEWIDIPCDPNVFVVNIGDLMAQWTNDRWVSTLHRVVPNKNNTPRRSLAFFHQPNWDADIKCIESCKGDKIKYKPVKSGPYLMTKFKSTL